MEAANTSAEALRAQIAATESELQRLKSQLAKIEEKKATNETNLVTHSKWPLSQEEYKRYGRQMIVPGFGIQGISSLPISNLLLTL
jgi:adenylyltransferase/sulfurtransferase